MNLVEIDGEIENFREKIIKCLKLQQIQDAIIVKQRNLCNWIKAEQLKLKKTKEDPKGIFHKQFFMGMVQKIVKNQESSNKTFQSDLKNLTQCIRRKMIPKTFSFESKAIPTDILSLVNELKQKRWTDYYGEAKGPFLKNMFILKKEDFHANVEQVKVNGLKFLMIEEKVAHRYQRNLVQEIFGRIFRSKGSLSVVIKIQVNHDPLESPYNMFCYIQDRQIIDEDFSCKSLGDLKINQNQLYLQKNGQNLHVNELNVLQIFLSEIMVVPVQSLISDFLIKVEKKKDSEKQQVEIIKCNQEDQQQIIKESSLKQHSSLRNPFLFFSDYIREHSIPISQAQKVTGSNELYASFYRCLEMIIKLLLTDFETNFEQTRINSSLCFNAEVFKSLWTVFHKISLISAWMNEVILPVKKTITIGEIITHFCPIFNEISNSYTTAQSYGSYRDFYNNVEMQSYLGSIVTKKSLEKYKDIFLNESQVVCTRKYNNTTDIYNQIFHPTLRQVNLQYINSIEASYILYFCCKFKYQYHPLPADIQPRLKEFKLWEKCVKKLKQKKSEHLPFIDIGFDILGYSCGINIFSYDPDCFERVRNLEQCESSDSGISWFVDFVRQRFPQSSSAIFSSLLEKSFKYKKFNTCKKLLEKGIRIRNFKQIIGFYEIVNEMDEDTRQKLVKTIQEDSAQMHRLFKWQQLMLVNLQKEAKQTIPIETLDFGTLYIPQEVFQTHIKNGKVVNNLSRKDYKFNSNREISLVQYKNSSGKEISFYLQSSQYPLMPYFYKAFLTQIGSPEIMPYFTSFFYQNKLYHIIESLSDSLNYQNGLVSFKEDQLNALTNQTLISEAIIISMIVPTEQIEAKDITICPSKAIRHQIFIVDWHHPYSKDFMHKYLGKVQMNSKNSLFLLQKMTKAIEKKIIAKYGALEIEKFCENVFIECKKINGKINQLKTNHFKEDSHATTSQLLALLFEEGFGFMMGERMHKIKRVLSKKEGAYEKGLSFYRLLEIINSQVSYYYQQIFNYHNNILSREKILFNEDWKRPFSSISLVEFFGSFSRLEEKDTIFPLHYEKFCFEGPTENNVNFATNMIKFESFKTELPQNISEYENDVFEYYMKNCDLSGLQLSKKLELAEITKAKSRRYLEEQEKRVLPLSYICIKSMQFVREKKIGSDISFERVEELVIESCKLSDYELNYFPKTIENILYLQLRDISGLKYIGENTLYGKSIEIKHLKTLSIIECHELISIDLKCDILENLELRNNKSLENINLFSLNLKNIYVFNNPNVNFENIGIYIIKGINVLICKSSCRGDFMKVFSEDYQTYVSYVLKFIMLKFFDSPDSRYLVMLTLLRMKEVEESLFALGGITNIKGISTIFKNFSAQFEDRALTQLIRVYLSNNHHFKVSIGDLVQSGNMTTSSLTIDRIFRLINQALIKSTSNKKITEIKFENTKFFFTNLNKANIRTMINRLNLDKHLSLILENLKQEAQGDDNQSKMTVDREIETIRYMSTQKFEIEKLSLTFRNSLVKYSFLDRIFHGYQSLQEIMKEQQSSGIRGRTGRSGLSARQSLKENNQNYMKIHNLHLDTCNVTDDRLIDLNTLERQLKVVQSQLSGELDVSNPSELEMPDICKPSCHFSSVRYLKLENCIIDSFEIVSSLPFLTSLSLYKCQLKFNLKKMPTDTSLTIENQKKLALAAYERLFRILSKQDLQILDLENFFITSNSVGEESQIFDSFCKGLGRMKKLKKLKLNKNYFSFPNLKKLDDTLNNTMIEELQLNHISLPIDKLNLPKNELNSQQQKDLQLFENLFSHSKSLKSLSIQLNSREVLSAFIISISKNQSLMELKLNTACELPSKILEPLNHNKTLSFVSSNMQLPVWLLKHVIENEKNGRKLMMHKKQSAEEQIEASNQFEALNTTLSLASMNSLKSGADFYKLGLSLDGGGVRGMLLATELNYLASRVGYPLHKIFDCIGGTSIGGILALASAGTLDGQNPVASSDQLMNIFSKYGRDIFKKTQIMQFKNLFDTKYSAESFEGVLKNYFKDCRLSNCLSETNVIVTAVKRVDNKDYIFRSSQALLNRDKDFYMRDVARATSAAPTYFPSAEIKNVNASLKLSLVDGGVGMNNPSKLVIDEVKKMSINSGSAENYFLLSLGTGKLPSEVIPQYAGLKDLSPIIDSFTESTAYFVERDLATNYKGHFFRVSPLINVKVKKDAQLDNTNDSIIEMYKQTGLEAAKKYFENTVIFGKYRNMNLIEWLRENTARKMEY